MIENGATNQREIKLEVAAFFTQIEVMGGAEFNHLLAVGSSCVGASNVGLRSTSRRVMVEKSSVKGWKEWVEIVRAFHVLEKMEGRAQICSRENGGLRLKVGFEKNVYIFIYIFKFANV